MEGRQWTCYSTDMLYLPNTSQTRACKPDREIQWAIATGYIDTSQRRNRWIWAHHPSDQIRSDSLFKKQRPSITFLNDETKVPRRLGACMDICMLAWSKMRGHSKQKYVPTYRQGAKIKTLGLKRMTNSMWASQVFSSIHWGLQMVVGVLFFSG